eukprot:m.118432 g.118432  ORF g.118432 m.118432 type:complete len:640 (-) comp14512_c0_seq2:1973-3892(-)
MADSDDEGERGEWQWHFIPRHIPLPPYPTPEELTARLELVAEQQERQKKHWEGLARHEQQAQEREAKDFIQDFVNSLVSAIPVLAEESKLHSLLPFAPGSAACTKATHGPATRLLRDALSPANTLGTVSPARVAAWGTDVDVVEREVHVYQARVVMQKRNPSCGYYALHFALACAAYATTKDHAQAARLAAILHDPLLFWRHFDLMKRHLLTHPRCATATGYPWNAKLIGEGVMEREYISYLTQHLEAARLIPAHARLLCLPEATSILGHGSPALIAHISQIVDDFRSGRASVVAVCLGVINHWVTLVCTRVADRVECVLLDSLNNFILDASDAEVWQIVMTYIMDRRRRKKKVNQAEEYLFYCQMLEIRAVCQHLAGLLLGNQDVFSRWYADGINSLLSSFERTAATWPAAVHPSHRVDVTAAVPGGPCRTPHAPCAYHRAAARAAGVPVPLAPVHTLAPITPVVATEGSGAGAGAASAAAAGVGGLSLVNGEAMALANGSCITPEMVAAFLENCFHPKSIEECTLERHAMDLRLPPGPHARLLAWIAGLTELSKTPEYKSLRGSVTTLKRLDTTLQRLAKVYAARPPLKGEQRLEVGEEKLDGSVQALGLNDDGAGGTDKDRSPKHAAHFEDIGARW